MSDFRNEGVAEISSIGLGVGLDGRPNGFQKLLASVHALGGGIRIQKLGTPAAPVVAQLGTLGATGASYFVVAIDAYGNKTLPSSAGSIANGNATPSGANPVQISIPYVLGAVSFDVLKTDTGHSIMTGIAAAQGPGQPTLVYDTGQASSAYTAPTRDATADLAIDGNVTPGGSIVPAVDNGSNLGAISTSFAIVSAYQYGLRQQAYSGGGAYTVTASTGESIIIQLGAVAITTITVAACPFFSERLSVLVKQDGTGGRSCPTTWTNVKFPGGTYTVTATASKTDKIELVWDNAALAWIASVALNC